MKVVHVTFLTFLLSSIQIGITQTHNGNVSAPVEIPQLPGVDPYQGPSSYPGHDPYQNPYPPTPYPGETYYPNYNQDKTGRAVQTARDVVALGESVYKLIEKGKPSINSSYAPINVVPIDPMTKQPVNPFDIEYSRSPIVKQYKVSFKGFAGFTNAELVYQVMFSPGGCYNGRGQYITNVTVTPVSISVGYFADFNVEMKVLGVSNLGSSEDPLAEVRISLKYTLNKLTSAELREDIIVINAEGEVKNFGGF